jgi:hypothetical protein
MRGPCTVAGACTRANEGGGVLGQSLPLANKSEDMWSGMGDRRNFEAELLLLTFSCLLIVFYSMVWGGRRRRGEGCRNDQCTIK